MSGSSIDLLTDAQLKSGIQTIARKIFAYGRLIQGYAILRDVYEYDRSLCANYSDKLSEYDGCLVSARLMLDYYRLIADKRGILDMKGGD